MLPIDNINHYVFSMLTAEFRRRLERLNNAISYALINDTATGNLLPRLFSVYSYLWCNSKYQKSK